MAMMIPNSGEQPPLDIPRCVMVSLAGAVQAPRSARVL